jgi:diguanylate cyclase (GGDEF)-like protein
VSAKFFFTLLNPAIAFALAATFFVLWRKRPSHGHLGVLAGAFVAYGLAFAINDFLEVLEGPMLRVVVNGLFAAAVVAACLSALIRAKAPLPIGWFLCVCGISSVLFGWFLFASPSVQARIYVVNAGFAVLCASTAWNLVVARPKSRIDWLFVGLAVGGFVLALLRPTATHLGVLDFNPEGAMNESVYWATVQALTPLVAMMLTSTFIVALILQWFNELRNEADRDHLTGLLNRRGFERNVEDALAYETPRVWQPAVMVLDIDGFKRINDSFGHKVGDEVIVAVADVLSQQGSADFVARIGGEEFALFYHEVRRGDLLKRADAIRRQLKRTRTEGLPEHYGVTVSIGIHTRHQSEPISAMMETADRALYEAKQSGKDRAVLAPVSLRPIAMNGKSDR